METALWWYIVGVAIALPLCIMVELYIMLRLTVRTLVHCITAACFSWFGVAMAIIVMLFIVGCKIHETYVAIKDREIIRLKKKDVKSRWKRSII